MIKVGIIGSGFGLYGLLPAFNSIDGCKVVAICGKQTERLTNYCKSIGLQNLYTEWREMLETEKLDAIAIAVVPSAQYEIAKAAIKKGIHVFAEKPLTANYEEAKDLLSLAKEYKVITAVDFIFQEIEEWQEAKKLIDSKTYGALKNISVNWDFLSFDIKNGISSWKTDIRQGGGALSFYTSHVLYYLEYFGGRVNKTKTAFSYSDESKNGGEVGVDSILEFENGIHGQLHVCINSKTLNNHRVVFDCEYGQIILENKQKFVDGFTLAILTKEGATISAVEKVISVEKTKSAEGEDERVRIVKRIAKRFVDSCVSHSEMKPSFVDGVRMQELIENIRSNT